MRSAGLAADAATAMASFNYLAGLKQPSACLLAQCLHAVEPLLGTCEPAQAQLHGAIKSCAFASLHLARRFPANHGQQPSCLAAVCKVLAPPPAPRLAANAYEARQPLQVRLAAAVGAAVDMRAGGRQHAFCSTTDAARRVPQCELISSAWYDLGTGNGQAISKQQLQEHLAQVGLPADDELLQTLVWQYTGSRCADAVSQEGFERYAERVSRKIARAFAALDADSTGAINTADLLATLQRMGCEGVCASDALRMVELLDRSGTGGIALADFARYACFLPEAQLTGENAAFCWLDSADLAAGREVQLKVVRSASHPLMSTAPHVGMFRHTHSLTVCVSQCNRTVPCEQVCMELCRDRSLWQCN